MPDPGDLRSVVLYRDLGRDRWRWAVYDSEGVSDGWLPGLSADEPFDEAAARLEALVSEHWKRWLDSPWVQDRVDWWTKGPAPGA